jgi:hypothetical protein
MIRELGNGGRVGRNKRICRFRSAGKNRTPGDTYYYLGFWVVMEAGRWQVNRPKTPGGSLGTGFQREWKNIGKT